MSNRGTVVGFCAEGISHVRTLLAPVMELERRGLDVHVFTGPELRTEVEAYGATYVDLYAGTTLAELDDSIPVPSRNITFAAEQAERVAAEVAALEPTVILYETFCVVAPVVARLLGVPHVNVSPNHDLVPERAIPKRRAATEVAISARCEAAVARLREHHGIADASPFYYLAARSPYLNLYPEPAEFLPAADRTSFEPLAFFGSLEPRLHGGSRQRRDGPASRILISLGTILWRYMEEEALATLGALRSELEAIPDLQATISLGGHALSATDRATIEAPNVRVVEYVDQRQALVETDLLITHHGLNSTHEAIFHEVPMLSCPFYSDQPAMAARCQELGLAVALTDRPRQPPAPGALASALDAIERDRDGFADRLATARGWETRTIDGRDAVVDRILDLELSAS